MPRPLKLKALIDPEAGCEQCKQLMMMLEQAKNRVSHLEHVVQNLSNGEVPAGVKPKKILSEDEKLEKKAKLLQKKQHKIQEIEEAQRQQSLFNQVKEENNKLKTELINRFGIHV